MHLIQAKTMVFAKSGYKRRIVYTAFKNGSGDLSSGYVEVEKNFGGEREDKTAESASEDYFTQPRLKLRPAREASSNRFRETNVGSKGRNFCLVRISEQQLRLLFPNNHRHLRLRMPGHYKLRSFC